MAELRLVNDDGEVVAIIMEHTAKNLFSELTALQVLAQRTLCGDGDPDTGWLDWLMNIIRVNLAKS